ncbi:GNAT family N-acetyltransferase [Cyclobacterium sp. 1_MG-2023]|uniref:GNAT family N-acetyltransferase n=1 Tax=Cyclobacterium sp. 1_MG-2023 TaxID=3062681 RepID=UPI0026E1639E|nr:GNAT family N-acetyltransferase [Cyclobacterium sp. 1_MG-2023]MDO6436290.1 GNAT family N-acetyltransferase [Cyclobacterium sp. 1_MG-2023]
MTLAVKKITEESSLEKAFYIREQVFVKEQNVAPEEEYDSFENLATHFLVVDGDLGLGTARWRFTKTGIKLERFAVLKAYRGLGVGGMLVRAVLEDVLKDPSNKNKTIYLHAQVTALGLYEKHGFEKVGARFMECDIAHFLMYYKPKGY